MKTEKEKRKEKTMSQSGRFLRKRKAVDESDQELTQLPPITRSRQLEQEQSANRSTNPQYRIVNWEHLCKQLRSCQHCNKGPLSLQNTVQEKRVGLGFISKIKCSECNEINQIRTDEVHECDDKRGRKRSKLNERCVLGVLHSGNGHQQLENLLAPMDIQCLHSKSYKSIERRVGKQIENVADSSCKKWLEMEKETVDGNQGLAISYDMGWQKRGNAWNSRTGHGTAVGKNTGKIVDYQTKNSACRIYESEEKTGKEPQSHDCRKNHEGSSKSMEAAAAVDIYERAKKNEVQYSTFIGDEDSTTISHVKQVAGTSTNIENPNDFPEEETKNT